MTSRSAPRSSSSPMSSTRTTTTNTSYGNGAPSRPATTREMHMADDKKVAVLGVGMHPWGKWGRNFVEYGLKAAEDALKDAGVAWTDIQYVAGGDTIRNGYPGF